MKSNKNKRRFNNSKVEPDTRQRDFQFQERRISDGMIPLKESYNNRNASQISFNSIKKNNQSTNIHLPQIVNKKSHN